jgi:hypothetical protein
MKCESEYRPISPPVLFFVGLLLQWASLLAHLAGIESVAVSVVGHAFMARALFVAVRTGSTESSST